MLEKIKFDHSLYFLVTMSQVNYYQYIHIISRASTFREGSSSCKVEVVCCFFIIASQCNTIIIAFCYEISFYKTRWTLAYWSLNATPCTIILRQKKNYVWFFRFRAKALAIHLHFFPSVEELGFQGQRVKCYLLMKN